MNLAKIQDAVATVVLDPDAHRAFRAAPESYWRRQGFEPAELDYLLSIEPEHLTRARRLAALSREEDFAAIFPNYRDCFSADDWSALVTDFVECVTVADSRNNNFVRSFAKFAATRHRNAGEAEIFALESAYYFLSIDFHERDEATTTGTRPMLGDNAALVRLSAPVRQALAERFDLEPLDRAAHLILYRAARESGIDLFEIDQPLFDALSLCDGVRERAAIAASVQADGGAIVQALNELTDMGIVLWR